MRWSEYANTIILNRFSLVNRVLSMRIFSDFGFTHVLSFFVGGIFLSSVTRVREGKGITPNTNTIQYSTSSHHTHSSRVE